MLFAKKDKRTQRIPDDMANVFKSLGYSIHTEDGRLLDEGKEVESRPVKKGKKKATKKVASSSGNPDNEEGVKK